MSDSPAPRSQPLTLVALWTKYQEVNPSLGEPAVLLAEAQKAVRRFADSTQTLLAAQRRGQNAVDNGRFGARRLDDILQETMAMRPQQNSAELEEAVGQLKRMWPNLEEAIRNVASPYGPLGMAQDAALRAQASVQEAMDYRYRGQLDYLEEALAHARRQLEAMSEAWARVQASTVVIDEDMRTLQTLAQSLQNLSLGLIRLASLDSSDIIRQSLRIIDDANEEVGNAVRAAFQIAMDGDYLAGEVAQLTQQAMIVMDDRDLTTRATKAGRLWAMIEARETAGAEAAIKNNEPWVQKLVAPIEFDELGNPVDLDKYLESVDIVRPFISVREGAGLDRVRSPYPLGKGIKQSSSKIAKHLLTRAEHAGRRAEALAASTDLKVELTAPGAEIVATGDSIAG